MACATLREALIGLFIKRNYTTGNRSREIW